MWDDDSEDQKSCKRDILENVETWENDKKIKKEIKKVVNQEKNSSF